MKGVSARIAARVALSLAFWAGAPSIADEALQFVLPDIDGREFSLEKEVGTGPLVLDFWATWCKPCITELPVLQKISTDYEKRGVRVVTINIDGPHTQAKIRPFINRHRFGLIGIKPLYSRVKLDDAASLSGKFPQSRKGIGVAGMDRCAQNEPSGVR